MNPAAGLLDLAGWTSGRAGELCPVVDFPDRLVHLDQTLQLARRDDAPELPDLTVELVRGVSPLLPPEPYGLLDLRLRPAPVSEDVVTAARAKRPGATVEPPVFQGGHLRLLLVGGEVVDPDVRQQLEAPAPVASNGLDAVRVLRRLTPPAALLLRAALADGVATFSAVAEMVLRGLAARVPVTVRFDAHDLLTDLTGPLGQGQAVEVDRVNGWWREHVRALVVDGDPEPDGALLATVLTDWTVATYGTPAPAVGRDVVPSVRLRPPEPADRMTTWDLSRGRTTRRTLVLRLDPLAAARQALPAGGRLWRETVVPPVETGMVTLTVDSNLPRRIHGLARLAVELIAPPRPPLRVHRLSAGLPLDGTRQQVTWRMSPREPQQWECSVVAVGDLGSGLVTLRSPARTVADRSLLLGVDDLPMRLVVLEATERLLRQALVRVRLTGAGSADPPGAPAELSADRPEVALPVPPAEPAESLALEVTAQADSGDTVTLAPLPATSTRLDLTSFPQYGDHTVEVTVDFDEDSPLVAVELRSEAGAGTGSGDVLTLTPSVPRRAWRYRCPSLFQSGYRWRHLSPTGAWSELRPAGLPLHLRSSDVTHPAGGEDVGPGDQEPVWVGGLLCLRTERTDTVAVVPTAPRPERDGTGHPVFLRLPVGDGELLQLGLTLGPHDDEVEGVRDELARRDGVDPGDVTVRLGPVVVKRAVLLATDESGSERELARSSTSGFPPFSALFSVQLDAAASSAVDAAVSGQPGRLRLRYDLRLPPGTPGAPPDLPEAATDVATWFPPTD